tara:strand:+ start:427 stop:1074 length:648 start_codon:yes stop_codon:yes gene_type:complete
MITREDDSGNQLLKTEFVSFIWVNLLIRFIIIGILFERDRWQREQPKSAPAAASMWRRLWSQLWPAIVVLLIATSTCEALFSKYANDTKDNGSVHLDLATAAFVMMLFVVCMLVTALRGTTSPIGNGLAVAFVVIGIVSAVSFKWNWWVPAYVWEYILVVSLYVDLLVLVWGTDAGTVELHFQLCFKAKRAKVFPAPDTQPSNALGASSSVIIRL